MAIKQDWNKSKLSDYLLYDEWHTDNAWYVLAGFDYYATSATDGISVKRILLLDNPIHAVRQDADGYISNMLGEVDKLRDYWGGGNSQEYYPPSYFIEWAISKRMTPDWLGWAIENKLYIPEQKLIIENRYEGLTDKEIIEKIYGREPQLINSVIVDKPLSPRTENNYLRLIMQLANNVEGFNPIKPFEAAALIKASIDTNLSDKTIAGYIQKAHEIESKERD